MKRLSRRTLLTIFSFVLVLGLSGCGQSPYEDCRATAKAISTSVDPEVWKANMKSLYPKMTEDLQIKLLKPPFYAQPGKRATAEETYSIMSGDTVVVYLDVKMGSTTNYTERYEFTWDPDEKKIANYAVQTLYPCDPITLH